MNTAGVLHMTNENKTNVSNTEETIAKLEAYLDLSFEIPKVVAFVKPGELRGYLNNVKDAVKADLEASQDIISREQSIIQDANRKAEELLRETKRQIEEQDIVKQAQIYAKQIVQEAQKQAQALLNEGQEVQQQLIVNSHKYVDHLFGDVEQHLREKIEKISGNRDELNASLEERMRKIEKMSS